MSTDAEQLGSARSRGSDACIGGAALRNNQRDVRERFNIVNDGGLSEQADVNWKRRLVPRFSSLAFDRVEERRLFAANVSAGSPAQLDVEIEAGAQNILSKKACPPSAFDG